MATANPTDPTAASPAAASRPPRIMSIDAARGLVMFTMIFVNDLAGADKIVPDWMVHFSDRHASGSGMTFVDLVFPGFLFLVGMSIPFALGSRLAKGEAVGKIFLHVVIRTLSLLLLGIMMVNESPNTQVMGWSATWWTALMYLSAMLAFCGIAPPSAKASAESARRWRWLTIILRCAGFATLFWLALAFRGKHNHRIISFSPFSIHHEWYGILGLIGWAYLMGSIVFLLFRTNRTALLGCLVLLMSFFPADKAGLFDNCPISRLVDFGGTLGSQPAITLAGVLLGSILVTAETAAVLVRLRFTLLFIAGFSAAAILLNGLYGISKNEATPSWCLWSCASTATIWLLFYLGADVARITAVAKPFAIAGQNVLLAYLISEGTESFLGVLHLGDWYDQLSASSLAGAIARSVSCSVVTLSLAVLLNRIGFFLKL